MAKPNLDRTAQPSSQFDVLILADFTQTTDIALRLSLEIGFLAGQGRSLGLVQLRPPSEGAVISPEVEACLRRGSARIADTADRICADLVIVHEPALLAPQAWPEFAMPPRQGILVCHTGPDTLSTLAGFPVAPVNGWKRYSVNTSLRRGGQSRNRLARRDWLPPIDSTPRPGPPPETARAVGWLACSALATNELDAVLATLPEDTEHFRLSATAMTAPATAKVLPFLSHHRITHGIDALVIDPEDETHLPDALVAQMLASGRQVVAPDRLRGHFGRGPIYFAPGGLARALQGALTAASSPKEHAQRSDFPKRCRKGPLATLVTEKSALRAPATTQNRPILALTANGVGIGHLTRLLALARRSTQGVVFAAQVPALGIIQQFGFSAEYIPSAATVGGDFATWDDWFAATLNRLIDAYDPSVVTYDGAHLSWGLVAAVAARPDCRLVWLRRGMWAATRSQFLPNARWCDLIIEPGEIAAEMDDGVTAKRRHEALQVDPIRLLDAPELLGQAEAAKALGLNPSRSAVLVQLGSGYNRDLLGLLDQIITALSQVEGLQIVVAEWVTGSLPLTLWPNVSVLRGFPISRYLRAFDFTVSAAGYNSFHEIIEYGIPTIFVANRHPSMDDQAGRAKFAQSHGAAFEISENDFADLPDLIRLLMENRARTYLSEHCRALQRPNGATAAIRAIEALVTGNQSEI